MIFYLFLLLFVGGSYIYYRYRSVSDKSLFFNSIFFRSITGSLAILISAILIVNLLSTAEPAAIKQHAKVDADSILVDTVYKSFAIHDAGYYYKVAKVISGNYAYAAHLRRIKGYYQQYINSNDKKLISIGHFGIGVIAYYEKKYDEALNHFVSAPDQKFPYLHFCEGQVFLAKEDSKSAREQFHLELDVPAGYIVPAFLNLADQYSKDKDFEGLKNLMKYEVSDELLSLELKRVTALFNGDLANYMWLSLMTVADTLTFEGYLAALAILLAWFYYLYTVDIFKRRKILKLVVMVLGGCLSVFPLILFIDLRENLFPFPNDGTFFNDLFRTFFLIGIPEEMAKISPLLLLLAFKRSFKEPGDYIIYACASALGFAFIENILYFQDLKIGVIHGRAYFSVVGHMVDSSIVAYGFVLSKFKCKYSKNPFVLVMTCFIAGSLAHAIYDLLLFQHMYFLFFVFFIFIIQVWIIIINNCLNNSPRFLYKLSGKAEGFRLMMTLILTSIFAFEYLMIGFTQGDKIANKELLGNLTFAGFLIIFFSSNLSSFNLVKGYWRDVYFSSREKRGYGTLPGPTLFSSWYLVNSIRAHNYVGLRISITNDPYNYKLAEIFEGAIEGVILNRIILYEGKDPDPHWFIVKLDNNIPLPDANQTYFLVKLRNQNDSLLYEDEVQIFFKSINDLNDLKNERRQKSQFQFHGWAYMQMQRNDIKTF